MSFLCVCGGGEGACCFDFYSVVAKLSKQAGESIKQQMMKNHCFLSFFGKLRIVKCYELSVLSCLHK